MQRLESGTSSALVVACIGIALTVGASPCVAEENEAAFVRDSDAEVSFVRQDSTLLLNANEVATAFGWETKVVADGQMLTLCRDGDNGICVPIRLSNVSSIKTDAGLFIDAQALARPLRFRTQDVGGVVTLIPSAPQSAGDLSIPAYNAAWGKGRGFRVGQTLPDIPLVDLSGQEVRFSRYLGKQYILYCWASW